MNSLKSQFSWVLSLVLFALLSCESQEPGVKVTGDYFPLEEGRKWTYLSKTNAQGTTISEELTLHIKGDTTFDGKTYKKFINEHGMLEKVVRKEGSKYFGRNHEMYGGFTHEFMFLDTDAPINTGWEYLKFDGLFKTVYRITDVVASETINGVSYENVLKLEAKYYNKDGQGNYV
jgi:hypothetical protein